MHREQQAKQAELYQYKTQTHDGGETDTAEKREKYLSSKGLAPQNMQLRSSRARALPMARARQFVRARGFASANDDDLL